MKLDEAATLILAAAVTALGTSVPDRRYTYVGEPAHDCEQLVVYLTRAFVGTAGTEQTGRVVPCPTPLAALYVVEYVRCALDIEESVPSAADLDADAQTFLAALDDLWRGLHGAAKTLSGEDGVHAVISPLSAVDTSGGLWGGRVEVQVTTL